jgi:hypothetical protein
VVLTKDIFAHPIVESNIPKFALEKFFFGGGGGGGFFWDVVLRLCSPHNLHLDDGVRRMYLYIYNNNCDLEPFFIQKNHHSFGKKDQFNAKSWRLGLVHKNCSASLGAPKLKAFKSLNISSNLFPHCNF